MEAPILVTSMSKKMEKERRVQLGLPDLEILRAQMFYDQVLEDMARYAESQKKEEIQDQKREAITSDRLQPSGLAGGGRRD